MNAPPQMRWSWLNRSTRLHRLMESTVVWSWIYNFIRLASGLILLPLVLNKFSTPELGMYYVLLSLAALVPLVDFGFGPTIGRFVSYAMGGAESIQEHGLAQPGTSRAPNYELLWQLLHTARALYRILVVVLLVVLGAWGTYLVEMRINEMPSLLITRLAWAATLFSALFDIYSTWWLVYLRNLNEVLVATRIGVWGLSIRMLVAAALLLSGAGLLSIPAGTFLGSLVQRELARRRCKRLLSAHQVSASPRIKEHLTVLWPNAWRTGLYFLSSYLTVNANTAICLRVLGLSANAQYGLAVQVLNVVFGMASVWTQVKWPIVGQYFARHDNKKIQEVLRPRLLLQNITFFAGAILIILAGPALLARFGGGKQLPPIHWFALMACSSWLELQFNFWTTLIFIGNRLPFLWSSVASNIGSLMLSLLLIRTTSLGLGALVLGPLVAGITFNYWYWPSFGARSLGTKLLWFLIGLTPRQPSIPKA